jgi:hypothetical protein
MTRVVTPFRYGMEHDDCPKCGDIGRHTARWESRSPLSYALMEGAKRIPLEDVLHLTCRNCGYPMGTFAPLDAED